VLIDKRLQLLRDNYERAYNELVRLGYEMLGAVARAEQSGEHNVYFRAAERAERAREKWTSEAEQIARYLHSPFDPGHRG
jgi:hypothetical protein